MNYAIIDLGTNTFNLLIAEVRGNSFNKISGTKAVVRIGQGGITHNVIEDVPYTRGINALLRHRKTIEKHKVVKTFAFATSAIRDAKNGREFSESAFEKTGIRINVLSGEKEAELIYFGVRQALDLGSEKSLIMDIGGGSTEFILANGKKIFWKKSFQLGVSRLIEKFNPSDPIKNSEIGILEEHFNSELKPLFTALKKFPVRSLIGSAGSFDSFADMISMNYYFRKIPAKATTYDFSLDDLEAIHNSVLKSTILERLKMKGLVQFRAENIVLSSILTQYIIRKTKVEKVRLSKYALKEGVLWAILNGEKFQ